MTLNITPSDVINDQLALYVRGKITAQAMRSMIQEEVTSGRFHPDTDSVLILQLAVMTHQER